MALRARRPARPWSGAVLAAALVAMPTAAGAECPAAGAQAAMIAAVEPRLELRLADGRHLRLVGLEPALDTPEAPDLAENARAAFAVGLVGRAVTLTPLAATPDRWGRLPALVFAADGTGGAGGLAARAVAAGLGRYLAEPAAHACRDALIAAEGTARAARLGLWRDPYYAVLEVDDRAAFRERAGTIVVAEGVLRAVEPGPFRTTLRFAAPHRDSYAGHLLAATILPREMKTFEAQQMTFAALVGRRIRFRGLLDLRFGPRIELASPDDIEVLATDAAPQAGAGP